MRRLVVTREAAADIRTAYQWYETQEAGLGREFSRAVEAAVTRAQRNPQSFRVASDPFRRALVRRFPFEVFYEYDAEQVVVHMVSHTSKDPAKWRSRLGLS